MDRKLRQNGVVLLFSILICLSIWHIVLNPVITDAQPEDTQEETFNYVFNSPNVTYSYPMYSLVTDDYSKLIDLQNFQFTILNTPCNDSNPLLLVLIHSAPGNTARRKNIRETWGQKMDNVVVLFMLGAVTDAKMRKSIDEENNLYGDFVQGSFIDHYRNLTYKHAMVFKYAIYHCPAAKYILKADDDVFVNLITYMEFLHEELTPNGVMDFLMCAVRRNTSPIRSYRSKWRVSVGEYPHSTYPEICPGWALLYSNDLLFKLYRELQNSTFFWIDDVLITGILMQKLDLKLVTSVDWIMSQANLNLLIDKGPSAVQNMGNFLYGPSEQQAKSYRALWYYTVKHVKSKNFKYAFQRNENKSHLSNT